MELCLFPLLLDTRLDYHLMSIKTLSLTGLCGQSGRVLNSRVTLKTGHECCCSYYSLSPAAFIDSGAEKVRVWEEKQPFVFSYRRETISTK